MKKGVTPRSPKRPQAHVLFDVADDESTADLHAKLQSKITLKRELTHTLDDHGYSKLLQPISPSYWAPVAEPIKRVVHTPIIEHPYDSQLRKRREHTIHLRDTHLVKAAVKVEPAMEDMFGLKVCAIN